MDNIRPHLSKDQQAAVTSLLAVIAEGGSSQPDTALAATGSSNVKPGVRGLEAAAINNGGEVDASKRAQHYLRSLQVLALIFCFSGTSVWVHLSMMILKNIHVFCEGAEAVIVHT